MNRQLMRMKADGIEPDKIKRACDYIFEYFEKEEFYLLEIEYLMNSMGLIMADIVKDDPLRKVKEFNYSSSADRLFSCKADSSTTS